MISYDFYEPSNKQEIKLEEHATLDEYLLFCKDNIFSEKEKVEEIIAEKRDQYQLLGQLLKQLLGSVGEKERKRYMKTSLKDFPLSWLKDHYSKGASKDSSNVFEIDEKLIEQVSKFSGLIEIEELKEGEKTPNILKALPTKDSIILLLEFTLKNPYFSKDDEDFYLIPNPVLKEKVFKVPMIKGSSWKGAIANAFKILINEESAKNKLIESYFRIFGAGSESIKYLEQYFNEVIKREGLSNKKNKEVRDKIVQLLLFELGVSLNEKEIKKIKNGNIIEVVSGWLSDKAQEYIDKSQIPFSCQTHKGGAIFYPTYFNKLSMEVINPHDRSKRAGTKPIFYEVVPKETKGILQIIYIPNVSFTDKDKLEDDIKNLDRSIEILANEGIGAKTKFSWGTFIIDQKWYRIKDNTQKIQFPEGWKEIDTRFI